MADKCGCGCTKNKTDSGGGARSGRSGGVRAGLDRQPDYRGERGGTVTLFSFDAGQGLSEHSAPFDALVQILDGEAELKIGGKPVVARQGQLVVMPANVPHAVKAIQRFKMLLTMLRAH